MKAVSVPAEQRVVLERVAWPTYLALLGDVDERRGRMVYDRGVLEIMSPSRKHENAKRLIGRLLETATEELNVPISSAGSLTMKREDLKRGIEPDECYYLESAAVVRGKEEVDLAADPPPELAVEVDITRSSIDKLGIYGALGVAEVWRYDGDTLTVHVRQPDGTYLRADSSSVLPQLPMDGLLRFLERREEIDETQLIRSFRAWLRQQLGRRDR